MFHLIGIWLAKDVWRLVSRLNERGSNYGDAGVTGRLALSEANGMPVPHPRVTWAFQAMIGKFAGSVGAPPKSHSAGRGFAKNREMKEEPTMLLITKDRL